MNASAAVRGLFRIPHAGPAFRRIEAGEDAAPRYGWDARVESIRNILIQGGRTIAQLSAATRRRYGTKSRYFIPATFLYQLKSGVTPHVCQIVALSESTGYRFVDWLRMCGFDLQQIPRLQIRLHSERTVLVTPLEDCFEPFLFQPFLGFERGASSLVYSRPGEWNTRPRYLFAKIGASDALACPKLPPGSIVRVDRDYAQRVRGLDHVSMGHLLWLVERPGGLTCCQVRWIDDRQVVLLPSRPPWGDWPLRLPTEARILGVVEMDLRPREQMNLQPRAGSMNLAQVFPPHYSEERMRFSDLLQRSRGRAGLTFRAAHQLTRAMARILGNRDYAIALGMLSDYEAMGRLPRHLAKILSLCVVYCMDVRELMAAAGVYIDDSAKLPLPIPDGRLQLRSEFPDDAARSEKDGIVTGYTRSDRAQPWKITQG
jgi:hypothetical protein